MRFLIYGAGGIGGTIGARLFLAGHQVVLIARGEHGMEMRRNGMHFVSPTINTQLAIDTVCHPREIDFRPGRCGHHVYEIATYRIGTSRLIFGLFGHNPSNFLSERRRQ